MTAPPVQRGMNTGIPSDVLEELIASVRQGEDAQPPPIASFTDRTANEKMAPNPPEEDQADPDPVARRKAMMAALYGDDFPLIRALDTAVGAGHKELDTRTLAQYTTPEEWCTWGRQIWDRHRASVATHLWLVQRNRLYRAHQQWVSSKGRGPWREPPRQAEMARVVHNLEDKALDQRLQVMTDQRPGFMVDPSSVDPDEKRKARARQQALEFLYDAQHMEDQARNAAYWAGTDGTAFWHVYWDRDAGPWDERMADPAKGNKGAPLGDLRTQTLRCEQVRVSSNATATEEPLYVVIRDVIPEQEAAWLYGDAAVQGKSETDTSSLGAGSQLYESGLPNWVLDITNPGEAERMRNVPTAERYTLYVDRHPETLPEGLQLVVVGNALVWGPDDLQFGVIPVIPVRDGSTDPSYFPRPIQEQWHDHQTQLNAALSLVVNNMRVNAGGRFFARPNAIQRETFVGGSTSIVEVEGSGPLGDVILPVQGFDIGASVKDFITLKIKAFEDASGYNDISRGQISGDTSGRAIMAAREQLERVFAPPVQAMAKAYMHWARVQLAGAAWGYDVPRDLGVLGKGRPDLARALSAKDFQGPSSVRIEEDSLMPMPKAFRMFLLDNFHDKGIINNQQYARRSEFAILSDLSTPDEDQEQRAKRLVDAIRLHLPKVPEIRWTDNEAIFQDVLEREILLQDDLSPEIIQQGTDIWKQYAAQAQQKNPQQAPPDPNSPAGQYAAFQQKIVSDALRKAESLIASAVAAQDFGGGMGGVGGAVGGWGAPLPVGTPMGGGAQPVSGAPGGAPPAGVGPVPAPVPAQPPTDLGPISQSLSMLHSKMNAMQALQNAPQSGGHTFSLAQPDLGRLADVVQKMHEAHLAPHPAPQVHVDVHVPEQRAAAPEVHVHPKIEVRAPDVHTHPVVQPAPVQIVQESKTEEKKKKGPRFHEFTDEQGKKWKVKSSDEEPK